MERHPHFGSIVRPIFEEIEKGNIEAITTNITLLEVLVQPYKSGNEKLAQKYRDILLNAEGLTLLTVSHKISVNAAN